MVACVEVMMFIRVISCLTISALCSAQDTDPGPASFPSIYSFVDPPFRDLPPVQDIGQSSFFVSLLKAVLYSVGGQESDVKTTVSLAEDAGYVASSHDVTTRDGYQLTIHRIRSRQSYTRSDESNSVYEESSPAPKSSNPKVVFLQHGLMGSSDNWVTTRVNESLAYQLADLGYDVWLGNFRGNIYSRSHSKYSIDEATFWKFSYDEMAEHDLPTMVSYVVNETGVESLDYVGHSMGSAVFFASLSRAFTPSTYFKSMTALAPVSALTLRNVKSPLKYIAPIARQMQTVLRMVGGTDHLMASQLLNSMWDPYRACRFAYLCDNIQFILTGFDPARAHKDMVPLIMSHNPAGSSTQTLLHFAQGMISGHFRSFDWGLSGNMRRYGQSSPPDYDVTKIDVPVRLIYSTNDWLVGVEDVERLGRLLPNLIDSHKVSDPEFSHLDFLWSQNTNDLVYQDLIGFLQTRESSLEDVRRRRTSANVKNSRNPRNYNIFRALVRFFVSPKRSPNKL